MNNPMSQFKVCKILNINLFGIDLSITNSSLFMTIGTLLFIAFSVIAIKFHKKNSLLYYFIEIFYNFIDQLVLDNFQKDYQKYVPFIASIFIFIFMGNILGMIPFAFTFTSQIIVTFVLALIVFILSIIIGIINNGFGFLRIFFPSGTPLYLAPMIVVIEMISFLSKPFSLSIRLFINMVAGHTMIKVFAGFVTDFSLIVGIFPFMITIILILFEFLVAFLQAYVFAMLSCMYIQSARDLH